jgi:hypothetical protein
MAAAWLLVAALLGSAPHAPAERYYLVVPGADAEPLPQAVSPRPVSVQVWALEDGEASSSLSAQLRASVVEAVMATRRFAAVYPESLPAEQRLRVLIRVERRSEFSDRVEVEVSLDAGGRLSNAAPRVFVLGRRRNVSPGRDGEVRRFPTREAAVQSLLDLTFRHALRELAPGEP